MQSSASWNEAATTRAAWRSLANLDQLGLGSQLIPEADLLANLMRDLSNCGRS